MAHMILTPGADVDSAVEGKFTGALSPIREINVHNHSGAAVEIYIRTAVDSRWSRLAGDPVEDGDCQVTEPLFHLAELKAVGSGTGDVLVTA